LALLKAAQKNPMMMIAEMAARNYGLVTSNGPMLNIGSKTKSSGPGAGKPQPLSRWHPPSLASTTSALTAGSFGVQHVVNTLDVSARGYPRITRKILFGGICY